MKNAFFSLLLPLLGYIFFLNIKYTFRDTVGCSRAVVEKNTIVLPRNQLSSLKDTI